jgi:purine-binding chemotaxis protein CheW
MSGQTTALGDEEIIEPESVVEFLEFRLGGTRYALEVGRVGQVVWRPPTTRVPSAPAGIYGAATVDGDVVVAVDTYAVVGLDRPFADPGDAYLVLLNRRDTPQPVGLLVEAVEGIRRRHVESVSPPRESGSDVADRWFRATVVDEEASDVPVFDSHQLVAAIHPREGGRRDATRQRESEIMTENDNRTPVPGGEDQ